MINSNIKEPVIIKKYPNRRLYNTKISNYVTLEDLFKMVKDGAEFVVIDAKSGEDLTKNVLTQIIFEQESKGYNMLPVPFLKHIISLYGNNIAKLIPEFLENSMKAFVDSHENMSKADLNPKNFSPMQFLEEATKQNMALFENTLKMFYGKDYDKK